VAWWDLLFGGKKVYVSPPSPDVEGGTGTFTDPVHSVAAGIALVQGGGRVYLREGVYVESLDFTGLKGTWLTPVVVQSYEDEHATIDSTVEQFRGPVPNKDWEPAPGGHPDEYVSTDPFPKTDGPDSNRVSGGAFLDREPYTRLITYDRLEDLRSLNELDVRIEDPRPLDEVDPNEPPPGDNHVWIEDPAPGPRRMIPTEEPREFRNWMYMGPGIWFDEDADDQERRVHIRLSHTNNQIDGWPDYTGETDPCQLRLALSRRLEHALRLVGSKHVRFKNLTMRFGGEDTIRLRNCTDIVFDHVQIRAASRAIRLANDLNEKNKFILFKHCEIDGGAPTWFFRSDRKDTYYFRPIPGGPVEDNRLGYATGGVLLSGDLCSSDVTVHHCEIVNGHDVYVFGDQMRFHHNWVHNINDDALGIGIVNDTKNARIYQNAITQCLTALSFAGDAPVGHVYIFRNLIDIRVPTAGIRPQVSRGVVALGQPRTLRQGQFYKDGKHEGPFDLFHNTCLVHAPGAVGADYEDANHAGFTHYGHLDPGPGASGPRRSFNNIFVAVYRPLEPTKPIAFLPPASFPGPTDGNGYFRIGAENVPAFKVGAQEYTDLGTYSNVEGYEKEGKLEDPQFQSFHADGLPRPSDDLRLSARKAGVILPLDLWVMDAPIRGFWALFRRPDRGCYPSPGTRLRVGVDGQRSFPPI
jgi:hypothetical protein